ncbi:MAG: hypothetical protein AB7V15_04340 [Acidimicrobiia bacterium]
MTPDSLLPFNADHEPGEDGATWLLDLVAAVDHLRRGLRPGLTVWDAIDESLRTGEPDWDDPDPLRSTLTALLNQPAGPIEVEIQAAVRRWVFAAADRYNNGHHWPHPAPRRGFPPPTLGLLDVDA